jgi:hypothetical protein
MRTFTLASFGLAMMTLGACAGRAPQPVAVAQPQDRYVDCLAILAEVQANNQKIQALASDEGSKVGQNVAAGIAGVFIWPLWFAMDFQGTAGKEVTALQSRQQYLGSLAEQKRCGEAPPRGSTAGSAGPAPLAFTASPPMATTIPNTPGLSESPPAPGPANPGSASAGRTVLFPVTINDSYHPHWTVGGTQ